MISFESSSLAFFLLVCAYLTILCLTPPNPAPPRSRRAQDRLDFMTRSSITVFGKTTTIALYLYHILLVLTVPNPPSVLCPHASRLDHRLLAWTSHSTTGIVLIIAAASLRLTAYKQLGPNFTFQLAKPKKLVTVGLYKYVQHPSYTAQVVLIFANFAILARLRTVVACWLPVSWWITVGEMGSIIKGAVAVVFLSTGLYGTAVRVKDEEKMLKEAFGKEWQEYNARTKRFIPWVI